MKIDKMINIPLNHDMLISISGILMQLMIVLLFKILNINDPVIIKYNYLIMIFNLLPIIPLDGYYILRNICERYFSYITSFKISYIVSVILLIIFFYINYVYQLNNYLVISFLIFKFLNEYKNFKYTLNKFYLERYLYHFDFKKIKNIPNLNIKKMVKNKYHFFKSNNKYIKEKEVLTKIFDNNDTF